MSSSGDRNVEELKRLVVHTLETNGVLGQIRAELRSNVYKVIDEEDTRPAPTSHRAAAKLMSTPNGSLMAEIVAEFFEFYEFKHSLSVFMPESNLGRNERRSRDQVARDAGLDPREAQLSGKSILEQLMGLATGSSEIRKGGDSRGDDWHSSASSTTASSPPPAAPAAARLAPNVESTAIPAPRVDLEASPRGRSADAQTATTSANVISGASSVTGSANAGQGADNAPAVGTVAGEEPEEAGHTEEGAPEEVSGKHRKARRKQGSPVLQPITGAKDFLGGSGYPGAGGRGQLPPLKASISPPSLPVISSLPASGQSQGPEEVSIGDSRESSVGISRESQEAIDEVLKQDRRMARFAASTTTTPVAATGVDPLVGVTAGPSAATSISAAANARDLNSSAASESSEKAPEVSANDMSAVSVESQVSNVPPGSGRQQRSAGSSPANSSFVAESPLRSPPHSPGSQTYTPNGSFSPGASPKSASAAHSADSVPEEAGGAQHNESISIDENESSGDVDLDLALTAPKTGTGTSLGAPRQAAGSAGSALKLPSSSAPEAASMQAEEVQAEEVVEEIEEEDLSDQSHMSYQSSEARDNAW